MRGSDGEAHRGAEAPRAITGDPNDTAVIITGIATDVCVLFTAADAYMREREVIIPRNCVTAVTPAANRTGLTQMRTALEAEVVSSAEIDLARFRRRSNANATRIKKQSPRKRSRSRTR